MARSVFGGRVIRVGSRGVGKGNFRPRGQRGEPLAPLSGTSVWPGTVREESYCLSSINVAASQGKFYRLRLV